MIKRTKSSKLGRTITRACKYIEQADDMEIQQVMRAVERRYAQMHPQWDVIYMAVHKEPPQRQNDLQAILAMLQKEETDSLA